MRKIVLLFIAALLFMAVPVMAVSNVAITCSDDDVNCVTVSYASNLNLIRAFGLDLTTTGANITKVWWDPNGPYRIYPGQISIVNGEVTEYGTPYDPNDLGDASVTIEMGSLYTTDTNYIGDANAGYGRKPTQSGTLLKFYVDGGCTYEVDVNAVIGGVVMEDPCENANVTLCSGSVVPPCTVPDVVGEANAVAQGHITDAGLVVGDITTDCNDTIAAGNVISTDPAGGTEVDCGSAVDMVVSTGPCLCFYVGLTDYCGHVVTQSDVDNWETLGRPASWCESCHCKGDYNGDCNIDFDDFMAMLDAWDTYNADCDVDYNYSIDFDDFLAVLAGWDDGCSGACVPR